jgi:hypothetical protein
MSALVATLCTVLAVQAPPAAATTIARGGLEWCLPPGWREIAPPASQAGGTTIRIGADDGPRFELLLTVLPAQGRPIDTRQVAEAQGRKALAVAVETELTLHELKGEAGGGHYFALTDRAPGPGEFRHMLQGVAAWGDRRLTFTLLSDEGEGALRQAALTLLRGTRIAIAQR